MLSDESDNDDFNAPFSGLDETELAELDGDDEDDPIRGTEVQMKQRLKAAVMYTVAQICEFEEKRLDTKLDKAFVAALTELTMNQLEVVAADLEAFSAHAKRTTVQTEDVILLGRRSDVLRQHLSDFAENLANERQKKKRPATKRKDPA